MTIDLFLEQTIVFIASFIANTFSALAGGGAGLLQLPVLIFLGLSFSMALATHKVATVALGIGATIRYLKEDLVERYFALFMICVGMPAVMLGAVVVVNIPDHYATFALAILTISLGVYSIFQKELGQSYTPKNRNISGMLMGALVLFIIGFLNGSLTSGTGLFATMLLVQWFGMDYKRAVAYTLIIVGLFWNATGGVTLALLTDIKWDWLPALLVGSFLGGYTGAHLAILKGNAFIKRSFEVVTILVGIKLLF